MGGALYGRALGVGMISIWQQLTGEEYPVNTEWDWMDPGILAVMGSASLLGGVTRLSLATTVIIVGQHTLTCFVVTMIHKKLMQLAFKHRFLCCEITTSLTQICPQGIMYNQLHLEMNIAIALLLTSNSSFCS